MLLSDAGAVHSSRRAYRPGRASWQVIKPQPLNTGEDEATWQRQRSALNAVGSPRTFDWGVSAGVIGGAKPIAPNVILSEKASDKKANEPPVLGAVPGRQTKGKSTLWEKPGGMSDADFGAKNPTNVRPMPNGEGGRIGTLPDGRTVVVRPDSSDKHRPTLAIQDGKRADKVRYGP